MQDSLAKGPVVPYAVIQSDGPHRGVKPDAEPLAGDEIGRDKAAVVPGIP